MPTVVTGIALFGRDSLASASSDTGTVAIREAQVVQSSVRENDSNEQYISDEAGAGRISIKQGLKFTA